MTRVNRFLWMAATEAVPGVPEPLDPLFNSKVVQTGGTLDIDTETVQQDAELPFRNHLEEVPTLETPTWTAGVYLRPQSVWQPTISTIHADDWLFNAMGFTRNTALDISNGTIERFGYSMGDDVNARSCTIARITRGNNSDDSMITMSGCKGSGTISVSVGQLFMVQATSGNGRTFIEDDTVIPDYTNNDYAQPGVTQGGLLDLRLRAPHAGFRAMGNLQVLDEFGTPQDDYFAQAGAAITSVEIDTLNELSTPRDMLQDGSVSEVNHTSTTNMSVTMQIAAVSTLTFDIDNFIRSGQKFYFFFAVEGVANLPGQIDRTILQTHVQFTNKTIGLDDNQRQVWNLEGVIVGVPQSIRTAGLIDLMFESSYTP